ncbi:periphilin-1 [Engraulis encrasicolus]|uniref:periphilin-1 n=1 Tax=Engraulis encrasicolus TaxID=184585 RepID=UPI002FD6BB7F
MAFRRERNVRDMYEERFPPERGAPYRRSGFGRPDEEYGGGGGGRGFEYEGSGNFYRGGPPPPRSYHGDGSHFPPEHRGGPPPPPPPAPRRVSAPQDESYPYYRGGREEAPPGRPMDFRPGGGSGRGAPLVSYPPPRSLAPEASDDTVMQAILSLDTHTHRGEEHEGVRRKAAYAPVAMRDRSPPPLRRDVPPPSPHNRSRGYSPERAKHPYAPPPSKKKPAVFISGSRDGSPHSSASMTKDESLVSEPLGAEEILPPAVEETTAFFEDFKERRAQAITAKAKEIEKVYRQDCETFGMVVKMLVAKEPSLEKLLQNPLKENLGDIRERCLDDLRSFIAKLDEATA